MSWEPGDGASYGGTGRSERASIDKLRDMRRRGIRLVAEDHERLHDAEQLELLEAAEAAKEKA